MSDRAFGQSDASRQERKEGFALFDVLVQRHHQRAVSGGCIGRGSQQQRQQQRGGHQGL